MVSNERSRQVEFKIRKAGPRGVTTLAQGGKNPLKNAVFLKIALKIALAKNVQTETESGLYGRLPAWKTKKHVKWDHAETSGTYFFF